ncbi:MAG: hypothetical protein HQL54_05215 [Magnetococcales bacterium]|nr:hypothetical protein [Magnetococcales bacterium]
MSQKMISLRISSALLDRVEQLVTALKEDADFSPRGNLTRAEVLREAIVQGCGQLEKRVKGEDSAADVQAETPMPATDPMTDGSMNMMVPTIREAAMLSFLDAQGREVERARLSDEKDKEFEPF